MRTPANTKEMILCTRTRVAQVRWRQQQTRNNRNQYPTVSLAALVLLRVNIDIHEIVNGIEVQNPAKRLVNCRWIMSCPISRAMIASVAIICMMAMIVTIAEGKRSLKRGSWVNTADDRCRAIVEAVLVRSVERSARRQEESIRVPVYFHLFLYFSLVLVL